MSLSSIVGFSLVLVLVDTIYVPINDTSQDSLKNLSKKSLGWQNVNIKNPAVTVHHNYSKVYSHRPDTYRIVNSYNSVSSQPYTSLLGKDDYAADISKNKSKQKADIVPHANELAINNVTEQSINNEFTNSKRKFQKLSTVSKNQGKSVQTVIRPIHKYDKQVHNVSGKRQFSNAHTGGYLQEQIQDLDSNYLVKEKIKIYKECPEHVTGQFVYELSCNQFLSCWKGRGYIQNCAPGTLFNPVSLECDFQDKVTCITGPRQSVYENAITISAELQAKCPRGFSGLIPHYTDCSKFINCNNGAENIMDCAPGTLFDVKTNMCDFPYKALCVGDREKESFSVSEHDTHGFGSNGNSENLDTTNSQAEREGKNYEVQHSITDQVNNLENDSQQFGEVKAVENEQSQYQGETYAGQTQKGVNYSDGSSKGNGQHNNNEQLITCPSGHVGLFPHPNECDKFLSCANGQTFILDCAPGTLFNPNLKICDFPYNVNCQSHDLETDNHDEINQDNKNYMLVAALNSVDSIGIRENYCQDHTGFSIYPKNCSKFIYCENGDLFIGICSEYTYFNPLKEICEENVDCDSVVNQEYDAHEESIQNGQSSQDNTNKYKNEQQWSISEQYEDFVLIDGENEMNILQLNMDYCHFNDGFEEHPRNCSRFLLCQNGTLLLGICKSEKVFNKISKTCDTSYKCKYLQTTDFQTDAQQRIQWENDQFTIFTFNNDQQSLNSDSNYCNDSDGFSVHPTECSRFLYCKYGRLYIGVCKHHMIYNHFEKTCDSTTVCKQANSKQIPTDNETDCLSGKDTVYPHPTICSKFIKCTGGHKTVHDCATGTLFNPVLMFCDFAYNVKCGSDTQNHQNEISEGNQQLQSNQSIWEQQSNQEANQQIDQETNQWETQCQGQLDQLQSQSNQCNNQWSNQPNNNQLTTERTKSEYPNSTNASFPVTDTNADYFYEVTNIEVAPPDTSLKNACNDSDFYCTGSTCIEGNRVCDGFLNCPDGEDEKNCDIYVEEFSFTSGMKLNVKEEIIYRNVSLALCAKYCIESKGFTCKAFNYREMDKTCFILTSNVGLTGSLLILPIYNYYEYRKYTIDCSNKYTCPNEKCIEYNQICDGRNDCIDRFDEKLCSAKELNYSIHLIGSQKTTEGAIEITVLGKTGFVCDDMFDLKAANVVCRELGFPLGAIEVKGNSFFMPDLDNNTIFLMDDVICTGSESSIKDCNFDDWGNHNCMEKEVAGVICKTSEEICSEDYWKCETDNQCVPLAFICDEVEDCSDNSDEASQYCDAPIEMRLADGKSETEGRVEIRYHGTWGTICDDDFNDDAGKVICRYLGYSGPAHIKKEAYFGPGRGPIWLDQVFCQGNESSIQDCIKWDWGAHNCDHSEDVGVICNDHENAGYERKLETNNELMLPLDRCGYRNDDIFLDNDEVHFRVLQSPVAKKGQYPWQASIRVKGINRLSHWCGAVIISHAFVLTAAHCLHGFTKGGYVVVAGDYDVNEYEGTEQQVYIDEFYIHEEFRKGTKMNNDIALVKLKGNGFNITRDVQPVCLPDSDFTDEEDLNCTISGFGSVFSGRAVASKELRAGWIPIQSSEVCKMPHVYGKSITEGMICAGSLDGGVDACDGDSGGPLACLQNGLFTLIGMTSWGQHCGEANKPGVYVKVAHYRNWIDETIKKHG